MKRKDKSYSDSPLRGFQHRVDDHPAAALGQPAVVGTVVDEDPQSVADLVGGEADSVRGVHGVEHGLDQVGQLGGQGSVGSDRDWRRRGVQDRISHDANGYDCHGRLA